MSFVIHGLSPDTFRPLFALDDGALAARFCAKLAGLLRDPRNLLL